MARWGQLWTQLRLIRGGVTLARSFKLRTQGFVHRLCDNGAVGRWLRAARGRQYQRAVQCVRAALDSPRRRALMLSATGVCKGSAEPVDEGDGGEQKEQSDCVTDEELQELVTELERVEELSRLTLYCPSCSLRLVIDSRHAGVEYCTCKSNKRSSSEAADGWTPYMETRDVIIWRKEYKKAHGLYAYKVYGRYAEVRAGDFAAVQTDSAYRRAWDSAVAALDTLERQHRGLDDQCVIHWEVMWPRLFANRDYVYVRRHKEFPTAEEKFQQISALHSPSKHKHAASVTDNATGAPENDPSCNTLKFNSPSRAKRKNTVHAGEESSSGEQDRIIVIVSKSCEHPKCPQTKHAIRVTEYWSHMVIRSLNGMENAGMEFVLTYYDEPATGGMPGGVAAWATGRAAPDYLARMRAAASQYRSAARPQEESYEEVIAEGAESSDSADASAGGVREEDMESSRRGPIIDSGEWAGPGGGAAAPAPAQAAPRAEPADAAAEHDSKSAPEQEQEDYEEEEGRSWWRYLYPFYYFA